MEVPVQMAAVKFLRVMTDGEPVEIPVEEVSMLFDQASIDFFFLFSPRLLTGCRMARCCCRRLCRSFLAPQA
jgi:hypothetical protein